MKYLSFIDYFMIITLIFISFIIEAITFLLLTNMLEIIIILLIFNILFSYILLFIINKNRENEIKRKKSEIKEILEEYKKLD